MPLIIIIHAFHLIKVGVCVCVCTYYTANNFWLWPSLVGLLPLGDSLPLGYILLDSGQLLVGGLQLQLQVELVDAVHLLWLLEGVDC